MAGQYRVRVLVLATDPARAASVRRGLEGHTAIEVVGAVNHADAAVVACARHRVLMWWSPCPRCKQPRRGCCGGP